jgi:DNA-binding SARP family transcriptional activator
LCLRPDHGIEPDYARLLIRRHGLVAESPEGTEWPWPIRVRTLGRFSLLRDDEPVNAAGKTQKRPLDMLKGLIALGGRDVDSASLMAHLWPDAEGDTARVAFDTTLHRLRKLLGADAALQLQDGKLTLSTRHAWVDTWAFERLAGQAIDKLAGHNGSGDAVAPDVAIVALAEKALRLYQGHFLEREPDEPSILQARARLKSRFFRLLTVFGHRWEQCGRWDQAISLYLRGLELDNLAEDLYRRLIFCHRTLDQHAEALNVYRRCRDMLSIVLGARPSPETEALYRSLKST